MLAPIDYNSHWQVSLAHTACVKALGQFKACYKSPLSSYFREHSVNTSLQGWEEAQGFFTHIPGFEFS